MEEDNDEAFDEIEGGMNEEVTDETELGVNEEAVDEITETEAGMDEEAIDEMEEKLSEKDWYEILAADATETAPEGEITFEDPWADFEERELARMESTVDEMEFQGGWLDLEEIDEEGQRSMTQSEGNKEETLNEDVSEEEKVDLIIENIFPEAEEMGLEEIYEYIRVGDEAGKEEIDDQVCAEYFPQLDTEIVIDENITESGSQKSRTKHEVDWKILVVNLLLTACIITLLVYCQKCMKPPCPPDSRSAGNASEEPVKPPLKQIALDTGYRVKEMITGFWEDQKECWRPLKRTLMDLCKTLKSYISKKYIKKIKN